MQFGCITTRAWALGRRRCLFVADCISTVTVMYLQWHVEKGAASYMNVRYSIYRYA